MDNQHEQFSLEDTQRLEHRVKHVEMLLRDVMRSLQVNHQSVAVQLLAEDSRLLSWWEAEINARADSIPNRVASVLMNSPADCLPEPPNEVERLELRNQASNSAMLEKITKLWTQFDLLMQRMRTLEDKLP